MESHGRALRHSPLDAAHRARGAKMVPFAGWDMPVSYPTGTLYEHRTCRDSAVAFDVSHLGSVRVRGPEAFAALQAAFTNDLGKIAPGKAQYTHLLDPDDASVLDDIIIWWRDDQLFDVMPNASNTHGVTSALRQFAAISSEIVEVTSERAVIAVQGPAARSRLAALAPELESVGRFRVGTVEVAGVACVVAGTGYTGEDGVELAVPITSATTVWDAVLASGIEPAGLGARDTLRLEAGLPLHGHELGRGITSLQAGLGWAVSFTKGDFIGRSALLAERDRGVSRRLRGLRIAGRQPARDGSAVLDVAGIQIGTVTSGNFSPVLGYGIAMAFLPPELLDGTELTIDVRGKRLPASVTGLPFIPKR